MPLTDVPPMADLATAFNNAQSMSAMPAPHIQVEAPSMLHHRVILTRAIIARDPVAKAIDETYCLR